jgi:hypothetical protein
MGGERGGQRAQRAATKGMPPREARKGHRGRHGRRKDTHVCPTRYGGGYARRTHLLLVAGRTRSRRPRPHTPHPRRSVGPWQPGTAATPAPARIQRTATAPPWAAQDEAPQTRHAARAPCAHASSLSTVTGAVSGGGGRQCKGTPSAAASADRGAARAHTAHQRRQKHEQPAAVPGRVRQAAGKPGGLRQQCPCQRSLRQRAGGEEREEGHDVGAAGTHGQELCEQGECCGGGS